MTRRRDRPVDPDPEVEPGAALPPENPDDLDIYEEISRLTAETGSGGVRKIVVLKKRPDGGGMDRCRQFTVQELESLDLIPQLFGGGEFVLRLLDSANRYVKQFSVSWPVEVYPKPTLPAVVAAAAVPPGQDRIAELILMMQRESQAAQERYTALLQSLVTNLIGANARIAPAGGLKDRIDELVALRTLAGEPSKPPLDLVKEALVLGMQVAKGRVPNTEGDEETEDEGGGTMLRVFEKGLGILERAVERGQGARRGAAPGAAPGAAAAGGPRAVPPTIPPHLEPYRWLLKYVPQAIGFAKGGVTPERAANAIYHLVPEEHLDTLELFARMGAPERQQLLVQLDPRLEPYLTFLNELASQLVIVFERESEGEDEPDANDRDPAGSAESA